MNSFEIECSLIIGPYSQESQLHFNPKSTDPTCCAYSTLTVSKGAQTTSYAWCKDDSPPSAGGSAIAAHRRHLLASSDFEVRV